MFQNRISDQPAPAVKGDFADANVRANVLAGAGALVALGQQTVGASVVNRYPIVGNFAWGNQVTGFASSRYFGETVAKIGFVHRENQAVIVPFLAEQEMFLEAGLGVTLMNQGSFWAQFAAAAVVGQKVFANYLDGSVYSAAAGTSTAVASLMTGAIVGVTGVLTISAITGTLSVGTVLSGGDVPAGVAIVAQLSGTIGGAGTYQTTATADVADLTGAIGANSVETGYRVDSAAPVNAAFTADLAATGVLTVSAVASGALDAGQRVTAAGMPLGVKIVGQLTGSAGDTGTYQTNQYGLVLTSRAMVGSHGHLAKISTWS
jgi:hypothetical protein